MKCPRCASDHIRSSVALRALSLKRCLQRAVRRRLIHILIQQHQRAWVIFV
ncbi:hypothetical protein [Nostoc sp.]|uniref:hypothetical protein n=1 Tax=Nostoc sp. TaxID=1180 RepID=UPI002FFC4EA3